MADITAEFYEFDGLVICEIAGPYYTVRCIGTHRADAMNGACKALRLSRCTSGWTLAGQPVTLEKWR